MCSSDPGPVVAPRTNDDTSSDVCQAQRHWSVSVRGGGAGCHTRVRESAPAKLFSQLAANTRLKHGAAAGEEAGGD